MKVSTICTALITSGCVLGLGGCDLGDDSSAAQKPQPVPERGTSTTVADGTNDAWEATADKAKTAMDQSESGEHIRLTADIRKAVVADDTLSMGAKNCTIVSDKAGMVWLRGVVESQAASDQIERIAEGIAGAGNVTNELEVSTG